MSNIYHYCSLDTFAQIIKNKTIDYKLTTSIIISGIIGAIVGCKLSFRIENTTLKKYFGLFLIFIALFEIFVFFRQYILKKKENNN